MDGRYRMPADTKVVIKKVPAEISRDKLFMHFQKGESGGQMKSFAYPVPDGGDTSAVIEYCDGLIAKGVLDKTHTIKKKKLQCSKFQPGVFVSAVIHLDKLMYHKLIDQVDGYDEFVNDMEVNIKEKEGILQLEGEWHKILCIGEKLKQLSLQPNPEEAISVVEAPSISKENSGNTSEAHGSNESVAADQSIPSNKPTVGNDYDATARGEDLGSCIQSDSADSDPQKGEITYSDAFEDDARAAAASQTDTCGDDAFAADRGHSVSVNARETTVDKDIVRFMEIHFTEEMKNFRLRGLRFDTAGDDLSAVSRDDVALDEFLKLYERANISDNQGTVKISKKLEEGRLADAIGACLRCQNVHISRVDDGQTLLFVGPSPQGVKEAIDCFRKEIGEEEETDNSFEVLSNCLFRHRFPDGRPWLTVCHGDIAEQLVDTIVNAANSELRNGGGVTGAIFRAGGPEFGQRCRDLMHGRMYKKLEIGEVVVTEATGGLLCRNVMHVVGPIWSNLPKQDREDMCKRLLRKVCLNLIEKAATLSSRVVAIPAIGTGIYGVPLDYFCDAMWHSILDFRDQPMRGKETSLQEIRIVNYDSYEADTIVKYFQSILAVQESWV